MRGSSSRASGGIFAGSTPAGPGSVRARGDDGGDAPTRARTSGERGEHQQAGRPGADPDAGGGAGHHSPVGWSGTGGQGGQRGVLGCGGGSGRCGCSRRTGRAGRAARAGRGRGGRGSRWTCRCRVRGRVGSRRGAAASNRNTASGCSHHSGHQRISPRSGRAMTAATWRCTQVDEPRRRSSDLGRRVERRAGRRSTASSRSGGWRRGRRGTGRAGLQRGEPGLQTARRLDRPGGGAGGRAAAVRSAVAWGRSWPGPFSGWRWQGVVGAEGARRGGARARPGAVVASVR